MLDRLCTVWLQRRPAMKKLVLSCLAILLLLATAPGRAQAAFIFRLSQVGSNVVVNGSGELNTTALTLVSSAFAGEGSGLLPTGAVLAVDPGSVGLMEYSGQSGLATWGSGGYSPTTASSGSAVVISGDQYLYVPQGYVSGAALTDTMTFNGASFATLGFTPGTYTYTWGSVANGTFDSLTVTSVVPEPSTWTLLGVGAGVLGLTLRRRTARA